MANNGLLVGDEDLTAQPKMHFVERATVANDPYKLFYGFRLRGGTECRINTFDYDTSDFSKLTNNHGVLVLNGADIVASSALNFIHYDSVHSQNVVAMFNATDHKATIPIPLAIRDRWAGFIAVQPIWKMKGGSVNLGVLSQETRTLTVDVDYKSTSDYTMKFIDTSTNFTANRGVKDSDITAAMTNYQNIGTILADLPNDGFGADGADLSGLDCLGLPLIPSFLEFTGNIEVAELDTLGVTVNFTKALTNSLSFNWSATGSGTNPATAGTDFSPSSGSESVAIGATSHSFNISILDDGVSGEGDETFEITLSNFVGTNFVAPSPNPTREITITLNPVTDYFNDYGRFVTSTGTIEATAFDPTGHSALGFSGGKIHKTTGTTLDPNGFKWNGIHGTTGTPFDSGSLTWDRKSVATLNSEGWTAVTGSVNMSGTNGRYYTTSTSISSSSYIGAETIVRGNISSIGLGGGSDTYSMLAGSAVWGNISSTSADINCYTSSDPAATRGVGATVIGDVSGFSGDFSDYIGSTIPTNYSQGALLFGDLNGPNPSSTGDPDIWDYGQIFGNVPNGVDVLCTGANIYGCAGVVLRQNPSFCPGTSHVTQIGGC